MQRQIKACRRCRDLFGFEPHPIVRGHAGAKIVQISQAPGRLVHASGKPFTDASGKRLREQWYALDEDTFYDPDNIYFAMAGHCYPGKGKNGDRKPPKCCWELWGKQELAYLQETKLFLVIGAEAAGRLFGRQPLDELVFHPQTLYGKPCYVLPHPSGRNGTWFKNHPEFEARMIPQIRLAVHQALGLPDPAASTENKPDDNTKQRAEGRQPEPASGQQ